MIQLEIQTKSHDRSGNGWYKTTRWDDAYRNPPRVRTVYRMKLIK